jgi:uncharacterized protein
MLTRIVIIGVLVLLVLWLLRKSLSGRKPSAPSDQNSDKNNQSDQSAALIACAHCGVMLPKADAFWREGQSYCSMTHRNLGPKR